MTNPSTEEVRGDVKALIRFYERRGWDWIDAAAFVLEKARFAGLKWHPPIPYGSETLRRGAPIGGWNR